MYRPTPSRARRPERGFTLVELLTVMTILAVLVGIALPNYRAAIHQAKEAVLKENLYRLRSLLDQHKADVGEYPSDLESLVSKKYLRQLPIDPMTGSANWEIEYEESEGETPGGARGVYDVRSAAPGYAEW